MNALAEPTDVDRIALGARVVALEDRLERERARNAGLAQGIEALTARVAELSAENAQLRSQR